MAEREGFEPSVEAKPLQRISSPPCSASSSTSPHLTALNLCLTELNHTKNDPANQEKVGSAGPCTVSKLLIDSTRYQMHFGGGGGIRTHGTR